MSVNNVFNLGFYDLIYIAYLTIQQNIGLSPCLQTFDPHQTDPETHPQTLTSQSNSIFWLDGN